MQRYRIGDTVVRVPGRELAKSARKVLEHYGASQSNAEVVVDHLIKSDLLGLPSHGVMRLPQYVAEIERGEIDPRAVPIVGPPAGSRASIDGNRTFGQVAGATAVEVVDSLTRSTGIGLATVHAAGHAGRIGAYPHELARRGLVALAVCSGPRSGHFVSPFGGREGRLATNPIAYAFPTLDGPVVADFATAAAPEGRIRFLRDTNARAGNEQLLDASGSPSNDPNVLYAVPPGTIRPLGGASQGHKGTALAILVELLATLVAGDDPTDAARFGNNLALVAVTADTGFPERATRFADYVRSAKPVNDDQPVLMPGDPEVATLARNGDNIPVAHEVWRALEELAQLTGVALPESVDA